MFKCFFKTKIGKMCSFVLVCASKAEPALNSGIIFSFEKTVSGFNTAVWLCPCGSSGN